jgi:hypothetical protein
LADVGSQGGIVDCYRSAADAFGEFVAQRFDVAVVSENLFASGRWSR